MRKRYGLLIGGIIGIASGCSGISDCEEDGAACAEMLNQNAMECAKAYQLKQSDRKRKYCENAVDVVGEQQVKAAVPGLSKMLSVPESSVPDDKHRREAAKALGEIGDPSAVDALISAMAMDAGTSSDPKDKAANRTNEEIATALGDIGAEKAVPKLLELLDKSRDKYVQLKAVRALGEIGDPAAVEDLSEIALTDDNKFLRKNAVIALGDIASPKAIDALIQMMFVEYQGVSFYKEASFALFQVGPEATEPLMKTLAGENESVNQYFEKIGGIKESAIKAKCGYVLADLRDERAVKPLIEAFEEASEKSDPVVLAYVAPALGALGDPRATPVLAKEMMTLDASLRDPIMRALNQIGDRSVVPKMIDAMTKENFVKQCMEAGNSREACNSEQTKASLFGAQKAAADHASNLAGAQHLEAFQQAVEAEENEKMKKYFEERLARVKAAEACKDDAKCWAKKLDDENPLIREKAAWELGRLKDESVLDDLADNLDDKKPEARSAAILAYWKYGDGRVIDQIEKQLEEEESSADYIRVNEDLKRLLVHLKRQKAEG